ncbi:MAG: 2-hydroxyacid dehydrogenase [Sediminicola sp.]|tara:strand:- start:71015 stop:71956 length:942 start_codon:yes stop_codon:yes gene_type:complete
MKVLHLDSNHEILIQGLAELGYTNETDYTSSREEVLSKIHGYTGIIIRSRFTLDRAFLEKAGNLRFIGRVGAGLENIDTEYAKYKGIYLAAAPEGNSNAVAEHTLGMLLSLFNKLNKADREVRQGIWEREGNRGWEIKGRTVGIIGYGNMGKAFAEKLGSLGVEVICYDILGGVGDKNARQVGIMELRQRADIISLHTPQTPATVGMINTDFINAFQKPIWFLNTSRGKSVVTQDLVTALRSGKVLGAALDVLEYEKSSFEQLFSQEMPEAFQYLIQAPNVLLSPHVAGWTVESKEKLAETIVRKIREKFGAQ